MQVGRVAYEMMQTNRADASNSFFSLDDIYYFGGQNAHDRVAVMPNSGGGYKDITFQVGCSVTFYCVQEVASAIAEQEVQRPIPGLDKVLLGFSIRNFFLVHGWWNMLAHYYMGLKNVTGEMWVYYYTSA